MTQLIFDTVAQFFRQENWYYEVRVDNSEEVVLRASCEGENGLLVCHAVVRIEEHQFIFYSSPQPFWVIPEYRKAVAEFLTRINFALAIGNFEMDFNDGEVRFRTSISIDVEDSHLTVAQVKQIVYINVATMDYYLPSIKLVAFGYVTPERAFQEIQNQPSCHTEPDDTEKT